jgi:hypothetical protein
MASSYGAAARSSSTYGAALTPSAQKVEIESIVGVESSQDKDGAMGLLKISQKEEVIGERNALKVVEEEVVETLTTWPTSKKDARIEELINVDI